MKDRLGREISNNDYVAYSTDRYGLNFYNVTLTREHNVQVQQLFLNKTLPDGYSRGAKISLSDKSKLLIIDKCILPINQGI